MNEQVKQAADNLLRKGEITQEEYEQLNSPEFLEKLSALPPGHMQFSGTVDEAAKLFGGGKGKGFLGGKIGIALGALAGAAVLKDLISPMVQAKKIQSSLAQVKQLPQFEGRDPEDVENYFNVIKTFSPQAATNPLVAGALVNKMVEFGGVDHKIVQDLASIQSSMPQSLGLNKAIETGIGAVS